MVLKGTREKWLISEMGLVWYKQKLIYTLLSQKVRKCFKEMMGACQNYMEANLKEILLAKSGIN